MGQRPVAVLWSGPASETLASVRLPEGSVRLRLPCTGTSGCRAALAQARALLAAVPTGMPIVLVGFSAGHGVNDDLVGEVQPAAYLALDSYYAGATPASLLAYAKKAADGQAIMVSTTSDPPGASWRTCEQAIQPLLAQLSLSPASGPVPSQPPEKAMERGGYTHLAYGGRLAHGQHATVLGPALIEWVVGGLGAAAPTQQWIKPAVIVATIAVVVYAALRRRRVG